MNYMKWVFEIFSVERNFFKLARLLQSVACFQMLIFEIDNMVKKFCIIFIILKKDF